MRFGEIRNRQGERLDYTYLEGNPDLKKREQGSPIPACSDGWRPEGWIECPAVFFFWQW